MNLRLRLVRHTSFAAVALAAVALIASPVAAQAAESEVSGPELAGTGYTDISTLDVVGWVDPEPGQAPPLRHPARQANLPRTEPIACGGRIDFYRIIDMNGKTSCYQKAGERAVSPSILLARYVCPGDNAGQVCTTRG